MLRWGGKHDFLALDSKKIDGHPHMTAATLVKKPGRRYECNEIRCTSFYFYGGLRNGAIESKLPTY